MLITTRYPLQTNRGFTILEVLLAVAIIALIAGIGIPVYLSYQSTNDLNTAVFSVVESLRRAQLLSRGVENDSNWGIYIQPGKVFLFRGDSFAGRNEAYDEIFDIAPNISVSGLQEVVFSKLYGYPQTSGTITLSSATNQTKNIVINKKGMVDY